MSKERVLVDTQAAAAAIRVTPSTIRTWARRGLLERRGRDVKGRTLYDLADIYDRHTDRLDTPVMLAEQDQDRGWEAHYRAAVRQGVCPYSGETVRRCQGIDLCDCWDFPIREPVEEEP